MNHGARSTYVHGKCRCDLCRAAQAEYQRKFYQQNPNSPYRKKINKLVRKRQQLAANWVKENRPDVWVRIREEAQ